MRLRLILLLLALGMSVPAQAAPAAVGFWWTEDHRGVIEIAPCGDGLCGRIVGQDDIHDTQGRIPVDVHGMPHCGLQILRGAAAEPGHWAGWITNPESGKNWHCEFWLAADGSLRLRGYVLVELFGETQVWPRFTGSVTADCRISPPS